MSLLADVARRLLRPLGLSVNRALAVDTIEGHLHRILPSLGVNIVIDVGGHYGEYAAMLRDVGYRGRIVSFEPVKTSYDRLVSARRRDREWRGVPIALGAERSRLPINVTAATDLSSFLTPSRHAAHWGLPARITRIESVPIERLDDVIGPYLTDIHQPHIYLKLDTQGFDLNVLRGAEKTLELVVGMQTEVAVRPLYDGVPLFPECLRPFMDLGYELTGVFGVAREPDGIAAIEFDCVLRRPSTFSAGSACGKL